MGKEIRRVGVASVEPEGWETSRVVNQIQQRDAECVVFDLTETVVRVGGKRPRVQYKKEDLTNLEGVFTRAVPGGSLEQVILRMDTLHCLERLGIPFMNRPHAIEKAVDKYYTLRLLELAGVPVPHTTVTQYTRDALRAFRRYKDVVVKPLFGSGGVGMTRVSDPEIARRVFRALEANRYAIYIQEFLEHGNQDIRVFVIGDKAIAAMTRVGDNWKTTLRQGAQPRPCRLTSELSELATKCAETIGLEYTGVDLLETEKGLVVTEVNSSSGWQGLQQVTEINITEQLVEHFYSIIQAHASV
ncbi:RimK family alpha-L-glutamate ligase [Candidatus Bathyarchaeota archaeon]|nr:RimK family alpha-L-glutamate ligase [Candidatus Bathyarchaeota archaeon]